MRFLFWILFFELFLGGSLKAEDRDMSLEIAKDSLLRNIVEIKNTEFLVAGSHQFKSIWTRDFCFSIKGLLRIKKYDLVKNQLQYLINNTNEYGQVPLYIDSISPIIRVVNQIYNNLFNRNHELPITNKITPYYLVNSHLEVIDSNIMVLWGAFTYYQETKDEDWWRLNQYSLKKIFEFYKDKTQDGLIVQGAHSDWQDSAKRKGKIFFTNLLYYQVAKDLGYYSEKELQDLKERIVEEFFDKEKGIFQNEKGKKQFSLEGNLFAIENEFIDSKDLYENLKRSELYTQYEVPGFATFPSYGASDLYLQVKIAGLKEYHGNVMWSWLMAYSGVVAFKMGDFSTYEKIKGKLAEILRRDQLVYEIYTNDRFLPFKSKLYHSEGPFSWGSSYILELFSL